MATHKVNAPENFEYADDRQPWERQPWEKAREFSWFEEYLKLGHDRNLSTLSALSRQKAAAQNIPGNVKKEFKAYLPAVSHPTLSSWFHQNRWEERAGFWVDYLARKAREKTESEMLEMIERHSSGAKGLFMAGHVELTKWLERISKNRDNPDHSFLSIDDIRKVFDTAIKLERLSRGVPDSITEQQNTGPGGNKLFEELSRDERLKIFESMTSGRGPS